MTTLASFSFTFRTDKSSDLAIFTVRSLEGLTVYTDRVKIKFVPCKANPELFVFPFI